MSILKINFEHLRQEPAFGDMFTALERGFARFGIDFYLLDATARDIWMLGKYQRSPGRATKDIDIAILVNKAAVFHELKEYLVEVEQFSPRKDNAFVLSWHNRFDLDLLPFGEIGAGGKVRVQGARFNVLEMPGLLEVYEAGLPEAVLEGTHRFKVCSLEGIILLKLIAWDDRPELRSNDIRDIADILRHFYEVETEQIWEQHNDLFDERDETSIAATVLGRAIGKIVSRSTDLKERVISILDENTANVNTSAIGEIMAAHYGNSVEENIKWLGYMKSGIGSSGHGS